MANIKKENNNNLYKRISELLQAARESVVRTVNHTMAVTYFDRGRMIVEDEQQGRERAGYGRQLIQGLSEKLTPDFGKGFSQRNLEQMRLFYITYIKAQTLSAEFPLSWSHYLKLLRVHNPEERSFYEIEAAQNNWSLRELQRQMDSALYERLALSRNKKQVKALAIFPDRPGVL